MNATIHPFPQGDSPDLPSLEEMCDVLWRNNTKLDDIDLEFLLLMRHVIWLGEKAKIETIIECRDIALSMVRRNGISL